MDGKNNLSRGIRAVALMTILLSNIGCDQLSKTIARKSIETGEKISVIDTYLILTKVENRGAFLSLGDDLPVYLNITILQIVPTLVLLGALVFLFRNVRMNFPAAVSLAFVLGGGIGNLYDRVMSGSVTDFLLMDFHFFRTGIFNMADVSIMIGTVFLMYMSLMGKPIMKVD